MGYYRFAIGTAVFVAVLLIPNVAMAQGTQPDPAGLVACWDMDEAAGVRYDATAQNNDLSDNNTVGSETGIVGLAASTISGNSEYLSLTDNAGLSFTDFSVYVNYRHDATSRHIFSKWGGSITYTEYRLVLENHKALFTVSDGATSLNVESATIPVGQWYQITAIHKDGEYMGVDVNGTTVTATWTSGINDSSQPLYFSRHQTTYSTIVIDTTAIYNVVLTNEELVWMHNGGAGRDCASIMGATMGATVHSVALPSGSTAEIEMSITAGDVITTGAILFLMIVSLFDALRQMAHIASKR